ncbi:hypothetical protein A5647_17125 [Mycobacterium sp. 1100029.7]|nr:hypothetical protein A5647_17125 [Mycobacterium sp. 1100029.7]
MDGPGLGIELWLQRRDRLEGPAPGLIGVGIPLVIQLETGAERPSHGRRLGFGESDGVQRCADGRDLGSDCRILGGELCGTFLDARGINLRLGLSRQTSPRRRY